MTQTALLSIVEHQTIVIMPVCCCMQSAPELQLEAVEYCQQDMTGQPIKQTAETLAILVDTTSAASDLQAAKSTLKQVKLPNMLAMLLSLCPTGSSQKGCMHTLSVYVKDNCTP